MPKATLDALIAQIVATAAKEIAAAVRAQPASPLAPRPAAAAPQKPAAAEPAKPAASKPHPRRSYTDTDIEGVLALITSKPDCAPRRSRWPSAATIAPSRRSSHGSAKPGA